MVALKGGAIERFMREPDLDAVLVLVYGPDRGLVRERAGALVRTAGVEPDDPFAVSRLEESVLAADPGRLADEAGSVALTAPRRVVWITDAGQAAAAALGPLLAEPPEAALVIAEAGQLRPAARLRQLAEREPRAYALPCYLDEARSLERLIDEEAGACGLTVSGEARELLLGLLGADRRLSRQELAKLCTYALEDGHIERDHVEAICGDATAEALERTVDAALEGEFAALDAAFAKAIGEGAAPAALLGALGRQLWLLLQVQAAAASGTPVKSAIAALRPPLHFKRWPRVTAQVRRWPAPALERAIAMVHEADAECRAGPVPREAAARQILFALANAARRARQAVPPRAAR